MNLLMDTLCIFQPPHKKKCHSWVAAVLAIFITIVLAVGSFAYVCLKPKAVPQTPAIVVEGVRDKTLRAIGNVSARSPDTVKKVANNITSVSPVSSSTRLRIINKIKP